MPRHVAFLRAINVGGRVVTMDRLRTSLAALGLAQVETFIASGNVLFDAPGRAHPALEARMERHLAAELGYEVATFVRSLAEVATLATRAPFAPVADAPPVADPKGGALHVGFLKGAPDDDARERVLALATPMDALVVEGRELWWQCAGRVSDSPLTGRALERALGGPLTMRNVTTVRRIAARPAPRA